MSGKISVAVVGDFQIGKSTLVNALIGDNQAEMGRGRSTTKENRSYRLADDVELIDTPGFDAVLKDDATASDAIMTSNLVLFVRSGKALDGDVYPRIIKQAIGAGKRGLFIFNCTNCGSWSPEEDDCLEICKTIESQIIQFEQFFMRLNGRLVTPVNALWAMYGLGLLDDAALDVSATEEQKKKVGADMRKIVRYLKDDLELDDGADFKKEALRLSGVLPIRAELSKLPMEVLKRFAKDPQSEVELVVEAFVGKFKVYLSKGCNRR